MTKFNVVVTDALDEVSEYADTFGWPAGALVAKELLAARKVIEANRPNHTAPSHVANGGCPICVALAEYDEVTGVI